MRPIHDSVASFEKRLKSLLGKEVVVDDLDEKHRKMEKDAFTFLRATCWRWAETAADLCPDLVDAPKVLTPGDAHIENFGLWRDAEGRLVWGIEDFDESAVIPYPFDLVRLGASARLADKDLTPRAISHALLAGYCAGLGEPHPVILEDKQPLLRELFTATKEERAKFWKKLRKEKEAKPLERYEAALRSALPDDVKDLSFQPRQAGAGSLGRLRFVALGRWRGGPIAREAKALIPSCWLGEEAKDRSGRDLLRAARGRFKSPDPWLDTHDGIVVRRLGPNSRKIEIDKIGRLRKPVLAAMGFELATIHSDDASAAKRVAADLKKRKSQWLKKAIQDVADATTEDWKAFGGSE